MIIELFAHLPGVALEGSNGFDIGPGRLTVLPFENWSELDPTFAYSESHYERSKPVFYVGRQTDIYEDVVSAKTHLMDWVNLIHLSFLLDSRVPLLPPPKISVIYLKISDDNIRHQYGIKHLYERIIGGFEREWIIYGNKITFNFNETHLSAIQHLYELLSKSDLINAFNGITEGLDTLVLTTFPEFWWFQTGLNSINGFVHCITALEHILLPPKEEASREMKLTSTFGQHAAVCLSSDRDALEEQAKTLSALYRLRSRLIHGETGISGITEEEWKQLWLGRSLLRNVIIFALTLKQKMKTKESLPSMLSQAYSDSDVHYTLFKLLGVK
jgi:hypothetical protein